jgi:predicted transcriptional regulator
MTTAAICEIVNALHKIGIGMAEAKVFVAVNSNPMKDIASTSKTPYDYCSMKLFYLMRKGLVKINKMQRPAIYSHTEDGKKAMKELTTAGMKK